MKLLLIPANYPYDGAEWLGAQNERTALALRELVHQLEILVARPYAPPLLALSDRWKRYTEMPSTQVRHGIRVHRPAYPVLPGVLRGFWQNRAAFLFTRRVVVALHRRISFDAILSFDLATTGGLAWRLGRALGVPACGWATGSDIRVASSSRTGRGVREALEGLDLVFYQNSELKELGARLLGVPEAQLSPDRHIVQSRGVASPDSLPGEETRRALRKAVGVAEDQVLVLHLGRVVRGKGLFELTRGFAEWTRGRQDIVLLLVGAIPGWDSSADLDKEIQSLTEAKGRIRLLPACSPEQIWEYFRAADIFAFPSFQEGMPNALLEAMLAGLPAIAFSIPAVREIARLGDGLVEVPAHDFGRFGEALMRLVADASLRRDVGRQGRDIVRQHFSLRSNMRAVIGRIEALRKS